MNTLCGFTAQGGAGCSFLRYNSPGTLPCDDRLFEVIGRRQEMMSDSFMARAIELSLANVHAGQGGPFGAVVVCDGLIIAEGTNRVTERNDPTAHAEIIAIRAACQKIRRFELRDCEMYASCEPCPMCLGAIYWARLARVFYGGLASDASAAGFDDALIYGELGRAHAERIIPMIPLMREQALEAFRAWAAKADKIAY